MSLLAKLIGFSFLATVLTVPTSEAVPPNRPIWSKKAIGFPASCFADALRSCKPLKIFSPDRQSFVDVSYAPNTANPPDLLVNLTVISHGKSLGSVNLPGSVEGEIVWALNSAAFFINGNNNGNGDYHFGVYRLRDSDLEEITPAEFAFRDMVSTFPPCRARDPHEKCDELAKDPSGYIGTAALDWLPDSSGIVIMAEVTCSSSMGGIMCSVLGYELEIPSGQILRRMEPKEFAHRWQHSMAWKFQDPGPPEFMDDKRSAQK